MVLWFWSIIKDFFVFMIVWRSVALVFFFWWRLCNVLCYAYGTLLDSHEGGIIWRVVWIKSPIGINMMIDIHFAWSQYFWWYVITACFRALSRVRWWIVEAQKTVEPNHMGLIMLRDCCSVGLTWIESSHCLMFEMLPSSLLQLQGCLSAHPSSAIWW